MKYIYLKSYNSDNCLDMPDTSYLNLKDNMKPDKPYKSHYYYMFDNSINRWGRYYWRDNMQEYRPDKLMYSCN